MHWIILRKLILLLIIFQRQKMYDIWNFQHTCSSQMLLISLEFAYMYSFFIIYLFIYITISCSHVESLSYLKMPDPSRSTIPNVRFEFWNNSNLKWWFQQSRYFNNFVDNQWVGPLIMPHPLKGELRVQSPQLPNGRFNLGN